MSRRSLVSCVLVALLARTAAADEAKSDGHAFVGVTFQKNKVVAVSAKGDVEWEYDAPACLDAWKLPNGNVLVASRSKGILEVTPEKKVVWSFKPDGETYTCQRLSNGNTLVGDNKNARLIEVDAAGKIVREVKLATKAKEHGMIRTARAVGSDRYLVCQREDNVVREYDADGKVVWEHKVNGPMSAVRLPNKNTLIAGYFGGVVEVDPTGKEVWKVTMKDLPAGAKGQPYGVQRLPNGNTVFVADGTVYEVTPEKKIVWSRSGPALAGLFGVQITDVPGDATKGEVLR
ncbi:MAG: PQQ-like beta-propeller repeat protein [Planctomycetes bacterium]|nr:PQQ-like beta-propeller repeat protein [Planctomycetota bacterium]